MMSSNKRAERIERARRVNELLMFIGNRGRSFFRHGSRYAHMSVDLRGRIWFHDEYTQKEIYTHYQGRWKGFSGGGTLKALVVRLKDFIRTGEPLRGSWFGPWHECLCGGDVWGYGKGEMGCIRDYASELGILTRIPKLNAVGVSMLTQR